MGFAEIVLQSKLDQNVIASLVEELITQRNPMPVGEVGKCLQLLTGCDNISKRLKEQFGGLKKTIETAS